MFALDLAQFANELIELGIGDFGVVGAEVPVVVVGDQLAQLGGTRDDAFRRCHA
jgi:hypothetical protein